MQDKRSFLYLNIFSANYRLKWALLIVFALVMPMSICHADLVDRIFAIVNDDVILLSDLKEASTLYGPMFVQEGYSDSQVTDAVLNQLIIEKLIEQQVKQHDIKVREEEIDANFERFKKFKGLAGEKLDRYLQLEGLTRKEFREQIKEQLLQQKLINVEVQSKIVVTPQDVKEYYDNHKDQYSEKTSYHLRHILMKVNGSSQNARDRVKQQMEQLYQRLKTGESFSDLAKVYSQSTTAEDGGDLGFFETRHLAEDIRKELAKIDVGGFTPVLDTEQGFQIFFIEEISNVEPKTVEAVTPEIQDKLFNEMRKLKYEAWLKDLRQKAHIQILD